MGETKKRPESEQVICGWRGKAERGEAGRCRSGKFQQSCEIDGGVGGNGVGGGGGGEDGYYDRLDTGYVCLHNFEYLRHIFLVQLHIRRNWITVY